jgi:hypothetical protein
VIAEREVALPARSRRRLLAPVVALCAFVACAQTGRVPADFAPTVPVARLEVEGGKHPGKEWRDAALALAGAHYPARIKIRGSSSALYPKKQFSLKLRAEGSKLEVGLLGMAPASDWVLASPYADKTLVKNVLGLAQARELFPYAPDTRWIELILNGAYHGVYTLTEKIERGESKVDVPPVEEGGFVAQINGGKTPYLESEQGTRYTLVYPDEPDEDAAAMAALTAWLSDFEASLSSERYTEYVHAPSFIDYFLQQELWKNIDGFRRSMFLHRAADGRLHMGPSWDFDLGAAGLWFYDGTDPEGWRHAKLEYVWPGGDYVTWFNELLRHPAYRRELVARWRELRAPGGLFSDARIRAMIGANVELLSRGPAARNFARWKVIERPLWPVVFFTVLPMYDSWEGEVWRSEKFLLDRAAWIDAHIESIGRFEAGELTY